MQKIKKGIDTNQTTQEIWSQLSDEGKEYVRILVKRGYRGVKDALLEALITE